MADIPVSAERIHQLYADVAEDVWQREERLGDALPVDQTADVHQHVRDLVTDWESGRKSLRTIPACNAFAVERDEEVSESVVRTLTGLDALVNVLDDVIDTSELPAERRIRLTVNAAFSSLLIAENTPIENRADAVDVMREYFTALFQIPTVEAELIETMGRATSARERERVAASLYTYRARDIDVFARLPSLVADFDSGTKRRLLNDLRTYRARRLLYKDIADVERDLADDDVTPILVLLRNRSSVTEITAAVERIHAAFEYSEQGARSYGPLLEELEGRPGDVDSSLRDAAEAIEASPVSNAR